jgi:hypothetical protein
VRRVTDENPARRLYRLQYRIYLRLHKALLRNRSLA